MHAYRTHAEVRIMVKALAKDVLMCIWANTTIGDCGNTCSSLEPDASALALGLSCSCSAAERQCPHEQHLLICQIQSLLLLTRLACRHGLQWLLGLT